MAYLAKKKSGILSFAMENVILSISCLNISIGYTSDK